MMLFLKAFVLEHKHEESKKELDDSIVEAGIAAGRWQQNQKRSIEAKFNVSRLEDLSKSLDWKLGKARSHDQSAQAAAEVAEKDLEEATKALKATEQENPDTSTTDEAPREEDFHHSSSKRASSSDFVLVIFSSVVAVILGIS
jgi:hypothetical protein